MTRKWCLALLLCAVAIPASAQQMFSELTGPLTPKAVKPQTTLQISYLTWGGDVGFFVANGGLETKKGSIYDQMGLSIKFTNGDDPVAQAQRYVKGETPFIRGTMGMMGVASEVIGNAGTKPVVFMQLTWSAGDHLVGRAAIKSLNDLKATGKKVRIAVQQGGPHVSLVYDILTLIQANRSDIEIVWCKDLSGDNGPAALFKKDQTIDCCTVITPDMIGLTGGVDQAGSGAEGTVKGAHVVASTQQMSRAIPDVLSARLDWYTENKPICEKIVAGYLKACVEIVKLRGDFEKTKKMTPAYKSILEMTQTIFGKTVCPTLEVDTHGLLLDASFVGLTGQGSFFDDPGNLNGFNAKMKAVLDLATSWGYAKSRCGFDPGGMDWAKVGQLAGLQYEAPKVTAHIQAESINLFPDSNLDDRTLMSFTIYFDPNQQEFSPDRYGAEFRRVFQSASTFGNAVIAVKGHSDPTKTLVDFLKAGMERGVIKRSGSPGSYSYSMEGQPLALDQTKTIVQMISRGDFTGATVNPRDTMQAALNLSLSRAEAVKKGLTQFATAEKVNLDVSQIQPVGAGILEPMVAKPKTMDEAKKNMRVEFRVIKVPAEALKTQDFDY